MMRLIAALSLAALGLAACEGRSPLMIETNAVAADIDSGSECDARAQRPWNGFTAEAVSSGPTCAQAIATLVVRATDGSPILAWTGLTSQIFGLTSVAEPAAMKAALEAWIDQDSSNLNAAANLPDWPAGKDAPGDEFPFYPENEVDRDAYQLIRGGNGEIFAFPQGMESLAVYLLREGQLEYIGLQTFPG